MDVSGRWIAALAVFLTVLNIETVLGKTMAIENDQGEQVRGELQRRAVPGEPKLAYLIYLPESASRRSPILVTVHGISRNAREIASAFTPYAERYAVAIVAPLFPKHRFRDYQRLGRKGRGQRADLALRRILDDVARRTGLATERFYMYGNSGGAQFAHRFVMAHPDQVIRYAVSAAGWYTMPDLSRKFPYGLKPTATLPGVTFDVERILKVPACVFVGENDTQRNHSLNRSPVLDSAEGKTRLERAKWWTATMTTAARWRGLDTPFDLHVLPRSGHDFTEMERNGRIGEAVFRCLFGTR